MSDKISVELFGTIFKLLAEDPTEGHKKIANKMWKNETRIILVITE